MTLGFSDEASLLEPAGGTLESLEQSAQGGQAFPHFLVWSTM